jgi:preprotein translocase subunit YajC
VLTGQIGGTQLTVIIYILIFAGLYYVLLYLPQRRRAQERQKLIEGIKVNDEVITIGGIIGTIKNIEEDTFDLQIDQNATMKMTKDAVAVNITGQQRQQVQKAA